MGDSAFVVRFGESISPELHARVVGALRALDAAREKWVMDLVPGYASVMVLYDALQVAPEEVRRWLEATLPRAQPEPPNQRQVEVPVWYHPSVGPDLEPLAREKKLSVEELIALHTAPEYLVYMLGFRPGFPFLGGLDSRLFSPRLATPRTAVPAGSVGIGGQQTGIYPQRSPGGWRLLGRTPLKLFSPQADPPFALGVGDRLRFVPINEERYRALGGEVPA
ncbi:5-oxoprolinase subunit PxpB [Hyalangium versicolor]|uniref:5-oxoprolinase subunit PxpB n=1 Tax=Hyalangium versicolor TaxID=2861190 RepID=UPI001CC91115|nr:5-oxoprolinase subunit PxpB [Hyalangium versicolor]